MAPVYDVGNECYPPKKKKRKGGTGWGEEIEQNRSGTENCYAAFCVNGLTEVVRIGVVIRKQQKGR